jgi:general secretion pathway protein H
MPISGPGIFNHRKNGFTLIELLVVLLVMGLAAGLIGVIAQPDERTRLRVEAERLAELLDLAATESRLTGRPIAWAAERANYRFWRSSDGGGWLEAGETLRARNLPAGMAIAGLRIEFDPYVPVTYELQMSLGAARYAVVGSPLGEVRIHDSR